MSTFRFASLFTKLFRRAPKTIRTSCPTTRPPLGLTTLEAREVPAAFSAFAAVSTSYAATANPGLYATAAPVAPASLYSPAAVVGSVYVPTPNADLYTLVPPISEAIAIGLRVPDNATVRAYMAGSTLIVDGTENADTINVTQSGTKITAAGKTFNTSAITKIVITGKAGDDTIRNTTTKPSTIYGGLNNDTIYGGSVADRIEGEEGDDKLYGMGGADRLYGGDNNDRLEGGAASDYLYGGAGNDTLLGGAAYDHLEGQAGDDTFTDDVGSNAFVYDAEDTGTGAIFFKAQQLGWVGAAVGQTETVEGGSFQRFQNATIYSVTGRGTFVIYGAIRDRYDALGGPASAMGLPVSDEYDGGGGWRHVNFEAGSIVWHGVITPTGARLSFDRTEMLNLFGRVGRDGVVDGGELAFLRAIVGDGTVHMPLDVRNLAHKVVNGDTANFEYRGQPMGDLYAGSGRGQLENLVNKWFRGTDSPYANHKNGIVYGYARAAGSLFGPLGPQVEDVDQGRTGDCYFAASLAAVAHRDPQAIRDMFVENADGTYAVRFYRDGQPVFVTVTRDLPVNMGEDGTGQVGGFAFGNNSSNKLMTDPTNVLWYALAEKAYAQLNQSGWILQDGSNSYFGISGGHAKNALSHITGAWSDDHTMEDVFDKYLDGMVEVAHQGKLILLSTQTDQDDVEHPLIVSQHVYTLVGIYNDNNLFKVYNPWGVDGNLGASDGTDDGYLWLNRHDMLANFREWTWGN